MRSTLLPVLLALLLAPALSADEPDAKLEAQKKAVKENWEKIEGGELATAETARFIVAAPSEPTPPKRTAAPRQ